MEKMRILVVDDNTVNLATVEQQLEFYVQLLVKPKEMKKVL